MKKKKRDKAKLTEFNIRTILIFKNIKNKDKKIRKKINWLIKYKSTNNQNYDNIYLLFTAYDFSICWQYQL
jgi:hypothetical protein